MKNQGHHESAVITLTFLYESISQAVMRTRRTARRKRRRKNKEKQRSEIPGPRIEEESIRRRRRWGNIYGEKEGARGVSSDMIVGHSIGQVKACRARH